MKTHYNKHIHYTFAEYIFSKIDSLYLSVFYLSDKYKMPFETIAHDGEYSKECCTLDMDGYWISNKYDVHDGKTRNGYTHPKKFLWRVEPNYCTAGRPSYSSEKIKEIYEKSETKKYLLKLHKFEICLEWDGFNLPTETCWGLEMKPVYLSIYSEGNKVFSSIPIHQRGFKKQVTEFLLTL